MGEPPLLVRRHVATVLVSCASRLLKLAGVAHRRLRIAVHGPKGASLVRLLPIDRILYQSQDCLVALCGDVMIQIWDGPAHNDVLQQILGFFQSLKSAEFQARKLYVLHIVSETASPPNAEGRAIAARFLDHIEFHANATEGTGFRAALIRSVIVGIMFLTQVRAKHAVTTSVAEAAQALVAAGCEATASDLETAVLTLRAGSRA